MIVFKEYFYFYYTVTVFHEIGIEMFFKINLVHSKRENKIYIHIQHYSNYSLQTLKSCFQRVTVNTFPNLNKLAQFQHQWSL